VKSVILLSDDLIINIVMAMWRNDYSINGVMASSAGVINSMTAKLCVCEENGVSAV